MPSLLHSDSDKYLIEEINGEYELRTTMPAISFSHRGSNPMAILFSHRDRLVPKSDHASSTTSMYLITRPNSSVIYANLILALPMKVEA